MAEVDEIKTGTVFESQAPEDDDASGGKRRLRVVDVGEDGQVRLENVVSGRVSHIEAGSLVPPRWRRYS